MIGGKQSVQAIAVREIDTAADEGLADRGGDPGGQKRLPQAQKCLNDPVVDAASEGRRLRSDIMLGKIIQVGPCRTECPWHEMHPHCDRLFFLVAAAPATTIDRTDDRCENAAWDAIQ